MNAVGSDAQSAPGRTRASAGPAERLLATASKLFAAQGIRAVGIDQVLREAAVAKASLYSTYGSKDALVIAYLSDSDQRDRKRWDQAVADVTDPLQRVLTFFDLAIAKAPARGFRGCLYANAATEYPDAELTPVREHREWMLTAIADELGAELAHRVQLLYDGALVGTKIERSVDPLRRARKLVFELASAGG